MIRKAHQMTVTRKEHMRGGDGVTDILNIVEPEELNHARLFSRITIPSGAGIGEHAHDEETEYYYILEGTGIVTEADGEKTVTAGDVVVTGGGATHAIRNDAAEPLVFLAVIILDD
jgi:quercetin dioxygenase-like cupin family protein